MNGARIRFVPVDPQGQTKRLQIAIQEVLRREFGLRVSMFRLPGYSGTKTAKVSVSQWAEGGRRFGSFDAELTREIVDLVRVLTSCPSLEVEVVPSYALFGASGRPERRAVEAFIQRCIADLGMRIVSLQTPCDPHTGLAVPELYLADWDAFGDNARIQLRARLATLFPAIDFELKHGRETNVFAHSLPA